MKNNGLLFRFYNLITSFFLLSAIAIFAIAAQSSAAAQNSAVQPSQEETDAQNVSLQNYNKIQRRFETLETTLDTIKNNLQKKADKVEKKAITHLAGYADVGYQDSKHANGHFRLGHFNPRFKYLYKEVGMAEAEVEFEVNSNGATEINLEYATLDLFINDYVTLVAGKFLSPLGQFVQNIHPSWINKFPSNPVGFSRDQAAPDADIGVQLRGGLPTYNNVDSNYAIYIANGPRAEVADGSMDTIKSSGFKADDDNSKVVGGRFGFIPVPKLELAISAAHGKLGLVNSANTHLESKRKYRAYGVDFVRQWNNFELRGEYIQQQVKASAASTVATNGAKWKGWYVQGAYRFPSFNKWEAVIRRGNFSAPTETNSQNQWGGSINYWFAQTIVGKLGYELNSGAQGATTNDDRFLVQLAYGF